MRPGPLRLYSHKRFSLITWLCRTLVVLSLAAWAPKACHVSKLAGFRCSRGGGAFRHCWYVDLAIHAGVIDVAWHARADIWFSTLLCRLVLPSACFLQALHENRYGPGGIFVPPLGQFNALGHVRFASVPLVGRLATPSLLAVPYRGLNERNVTRRQPSGVYMRTKLQLNTRETQKSSSLGRITKSETASPRQAQVNARAHSCTRALAHSRAHARRAYTTLRVYMHAYTHACAQARLHRRHRDQHSKHVHKTHATAYHSTAFSALHAPARCRSPVTARLAGARCSLPPYSCQTPSAVGPCRHIIKTSHPLATSTVPPPPRPLV